MAEPDAIAEADQAVPVPQVVASYATYLHTRTLAEPEISVVGSRAAQVSVSRSDKTLTLTFGRRSREWSLDGADVRHGEQLTRFNRRELARAVAALLAT